ncbi:hypothetical protein RHSIM_Rhsim13G0049400 [Rhododendron simsii]|uniref:Uncharacterized protein n=1 Tax=Rhododendron simsii TaxID=118357 RepID=A0A834G134_RHOSS|nr:hypothetical protein RHSIM_Rhsim13G0049400 [Rhododendron simsii]
MAAAAAPAAQQSISAQAVGNAFVQQYYHIQHQSPALVHRFYQDISKLGRPDGDGAMSTTTTMKAINKKIRSLKYDEFRAEIKSVDAQESYKGGVHVLVTGCLSGKDNMIQNFTQTFFLAPQEKGYFVLNDIFRYMEVIKLANGNQSFGTDIEAPLTPEQDPSPVVENHVSEQTVVPAEVNGDVIGSDIGEWAMVMKESAMPLSSPAPVPRRSPVNSQAQQVNNTQASAPVAETPVSGSDAADNGNNQEGEEGEADGYSIYIKGLPMNATAPLLEDEFKKFGTIKAGGVQVRSNKQGFCFGFVEFEVESAVQKAIEASPVSIGGRPAYVEEKRSTNSRGKLGNNRGRFVNGRGSGFRNEGVRGRGNYGGSGGRGYNRGDFNGRTEFGNNRSSNRGGFSNRGGDAYQRADNNGGGRANRGGGMGVNGTAKTLPPRVSATA